MSLLARLDDGSSVEIVLDGYTTSLERLDSYLQNTPSSIGGWNARAAGFRYFDRQWWLPTATGVVPLRRVVEFTSPEGEATA